MASILSVPGRDDVENQDATALGDGIAVLVDGAGLPAHLLGGCHHPVGWYSTHLAEAYRDELARRDSSLQQALSRALQTVASLHPECDLAAGSHSATVAAWRITGMDSTETTRSLAESRPAGQEPIQQGLATAAARQPPADPRVHDQTDDGPESTAPQAAGGGAAGRAHTRREVEYLVLCDASVILVDADGHAEQVTDTRLAELVDPLETTLTSREEILASRADALERHRNRPDGFWCAHHDPSAAFHAITGRRRVDELSAIVLTSDGATRGHELLDALPLQELADLVVAGHADRAVALIRQAEDDQAERLFQRGHKAHDDTTVVWEPLPGTPH